MAFLRHLRKGINHFLRLLYSSPNLFVNVIPLFLPNELTGDYDGCNERV